MLAAQPNLTPKEALGKALFFDKRLSRPAGQSCASCHDPRTGWTSPVENLAGPMEGAVKGRFGNRKPPTSAYAGWTPKLHRNAEGKYVGGLFWDGRATGHQREILAEQAEGPFLNPLEHALPDRKTFAVLLRTAPYAAEFARVWKLVPSDWTNSDHVFRLATDAIAAYERSAEVNPFDSRFDDFWRAALGKGLNVADIRPGNVSRYAGLGLNEQELRGLAFFHRMGRCSECHTLDPGPGTTPPLFTNFTYDNLGIPRNAENPFYTMPAPHNPEGKAWVDPGLGATLKALPADAPYAAANHGKHRVPTLRNVDKRPAPTFTKTFGHNGFFKSLEHIVTFYNRRDTGIFPPPEVTASVNKDQLGKLGLTPEQETAIVAFMKTLTDRTTAQPPK
jgi:cytochrome c peroxidase